MLDSGIKDGSVLFSYDTIYRYQDLIIRLFFVICGGYVPDFWTVNTEFAFKKMSILLMMINELANFNVRTLL